MILMESFNIWYLVVFILAIIIATVITCIKTFGRDKKIDKINEEIKHDEKVLDDESSILKKK